MPVRSQCGVLTSICDRGMLASHFIDVMRFFLRLAWILKNFRILRKPFRGIPWLKLSNDEQSNSLSQFVISLIELEPFLFIFSWPTQSPLATAWVRRWSPTIFNLTTALWVTIPTYKYICWRPWMIQSYWALHSSWSIKKSNYKMFVIGLKKKWAITACLWSGRTNADPTKLIVGGWGRSFGLWPTGQENVWRNCLRLQLPNWN